MAEADRPANRLANEASPYLRQHMYNPVDWYPWGAEALAKAASEQKPILLSIGYAACHWCHVMEKDAFEVDSVARLMNDGFVSIKVDREERPDLDALYQGVVQLMGRGGGWPLTVFLTPDLSPFFGGTYFPPVDGYGLPSFTRLLESIRRAWETRRQEVLESAESFKDGLARYVNMGVGVAEEGPTAHDLARAAEQIAGALDREHGGFFGAPKFPHPMELAFLLRMASSPPEGMDDELRRSADFAVRFSLDEMARGGIHDQLGGGFHRYSVDEGWRVPHFEKMLYDNAQLLRLYAEASAAFGDGAYERVARGIAEWLDRELTDQRGAFHSSQDADSEGVEGKFFVWTPAELRAVLGEELAAIAASHFGVTEEGNFEGGATVLHRPGSSSSLLVRDEGSRSLLEGEPRIAEAKRLLFEARSRRIPPATDDKVITAWNGLAIGGLAAAGRLLGEPAMIARARRAASFVLDTMRTKDGLWRVYRDGALKQAAFLDDWACLCEGLLELFEATGEHLFLDEAHELARAIADHFWSEEQSCFFLSPPDGEALLHPIPSTYDNAVPSGASSATVAFLRLHALTGDDHLGRIAERWLQRQRDELQRNPFAFGHLLVAAFLHVKGISEVAVIGREGPARDALLDAARRGFHPEVLAYAAERGEGELLAGKGEVDGRPAAYVCRRFACEAPRVDPEEVSRALGFQ